eukprot:2170506-Lingulodinium_polyedra.AAC.1
MPRDRILLSTLPHVPCSYKPGREWPWTPTWAPHNGGKMAPMMRTQGLDPLRPLGPPFQCAAPAL